jgi:DNA polymerase V
VSSVNANTPRRIALVDCNNFYCSCERVFRPAWEGRPVAVLSNNDGCIIARSSELKALGVPMGMPYFQAKGLLKKEKAVVVSSNYALYGDMSTRVMQLLGRFTPELEVYSIDEAFLDLTGFDAATLPDYARGIVRMVKQWTGIPVGIGIAPTKVLAKIANHIAKNRQVPGGVFDLGGAGELDALLETIAVTDIWGIGRRWGKQLQALGIGNARQLRDADAVDMRRRFSVVMQRIVLELRGIPCLSLEEIAPKKTIMASRSFGQRVTERESLEEAVALHVARAAEKLRHQGSVAGAMVVMIRTGRHHPEEPYFAPSCTVPFPVPSADTGKMTAAAVQGVQRIYRAGHRYAKAGVMLLELSPASQCQPALFAAGDSEKSIRLMQAMDQLNRDYGRGTVFYAREGIAKSWAMKRGRMTAAYTTSWEGLVGVG